MKFKLTRSSCWSNDTIEVSGDWKVTTEEKTTYRMDGGEYSWIEYHIEINTLEELLRFSKEQGSDLVLMGYLEDTPVVEIYDDYRE